MKLPLLILLTLVLAGCNSQADHGEAHKITWTPSPTADGYSLYCGSTSGVYTQNLNIGGGLTNEIPLSDITLTDGIHFCALKAFNFAGDSPYSNEIEFAIRGGDLLTLPPVAPTGLVIT